MAITKLNGNDYIVFIDTTTPTTAEAGVTAEYDPIMCMSTNGISGTTESIETADKCSGGFASPLPGTASWSITGSGNAIDETLEPSSVSLDRLFNLWKNKTPFWAKMANKTAGTGAPIIREGVVFISDYSETADTNTPYTFDFTFTGMGELNGTPSV